MAESKECFEKRSLKKGSVNWVLLMSLGIACAISGDFSGWSTGTGYGSARAPDPRRARVPAPAVPPAVPPARRPICFRRFRENAALWQPVLRGGLSWMADERNMRGRQMGNAALIWGNTCC